MSRDAREAIADEQNSVAVSAASAMEVATNYRIGTLPGAARLARDFEVIVASQGFSELPITVHHARLAGEMTIAHTDPFDRFLIAQAQAERWSWFRKKSCSRLRGPACLVGPERDDRMGVLAGDPAGVAGGPADRGDFAALSGGVR